MLAAGSRGEGWTGQFERYADALDRGAPPPVTIDDVRDVMEVITAVYASARTGRRWTAPRS